MVTIKPTEGFIKLFITNNNGTVETELHNLVIAQDDILDETQPKSKDNDGLGLNIAFVMLESVSAAAFARVMHNSLDFLQNQQDTIFFKGKRYNERIFL